MFLVGWIVAEKMGRVQKLDGGFRHKIAAVPVFPEAEGGEGAPRLPFPLGLQILIAGVEVVHYENSPFLSSG